MQSYAESMAKKVPAQTTVSRSVIKKLDALACARKCSRASYLRQLIEMHVRAVNPELLRTLDQLPQEPR